MLTVFPKDRLQDQQVRLQEQERLLFSYVSHLHDHHATMGTEESYRALEIAKERWLRVRDALANCLSECQQA